MSPEKVPNQTGSRGARLWWLLPWLTALLAGLFYYLWMRRKHGDQIQPVRIDLSFFRGQGVTDESARQAAAEIVREIAREPEEVQVESQSPVPGADREETNAAEAEPVPTIPDDLTVISGIGPKTAAVLQAAGLDTFTRLADVEPDHLQEILLAANLRLADPSTWPEQARMAAAGKLDEIKEFMARHRGGK